MKKLSVASLVLAAFLWSPTGGAGPVWKGCVDEAGDPIPCEKDPADPGGGSGDPCSAAQRGSCESMTIYPEGFECTARWCAPDPSAWFKCASHNTKTCQNGTDAAGEPVFVMINSCDFCGF